MHLIEDEVCVEPQADVMEGPAEVLWHRMHFLVDRIRIQDPKSSISPTLMGLHVELLSHRAIDVSID